LRQGQRLGKNDRLVTWRKPGQTPRYLPNPLWKRIHDQLSVRIFGYAVQGRGFRSQSLTLVTTLTDVQASPAAELAWL
jgi:hypothetical protein